MNLNQQVFGGWKDCSRHSSEIISFEDSDGLGMVAAGGVQMVKHVVSTEKEDDEDEETPSEDDSADGDSEEEDNSDKEENEDHSTVVDTKCRMPTIGEDSNSSSLNSSFNGLHISEKDSYLRVAPVSIDITVDTSIKDDAYSPDAQSDKLAEESSNDDPLELIESHDGIES
jgi:hypothetical protein